MNLHRQLPEILTGYALDERGGFWSVIVPEATTNLILNPSFETDFDISNPIWVWEGVDDVERTTLKSSRGQYSIRIDPFVGGDSHMRYQRDTTAGTAYTFSCDVWAPYGLEFYLNVGPLITPPTPVARSKVFIGNSNWQRVHMTYVETTSTTRYFRLSFVDDNEVNSLWTDAWQLEEKYYPTTYCDGDQPGLSDLPWLKEYWWNGIRYESTSSRGPRTRAGGREVNLLDEAFFQTTQIVGLGMREHEQFATELGNGRFRYEHSRPVAPSEIIISGMLYGKDYSELSRRRKALVELFRPDLTPDEQPILLRYRAVDTSGFAYGDVLEIPVVYQDGLQGRIESRYGENISLRFLTYEPGMRSVHDTVTSLPANTRFIDTVPVFIRDRVHNWLQLGSGATSAGTTAHALAYMLNGDIVAGGTFTQIGGVASANYIARFDGTDWNAMGDGFNDYVYDIARAEGAHNGYIYAVGAFTADGNGAGTFRRAAYWDPSVGVWAEAGTGFNGQVSAVATDGLYVYFGGLFTELGDGTTANYFVRYNTSANTWSVIGSQFNNFVHAIAIAPNGDVYVGGIFTNANAGIPAPRVAKYSYSTGLWSAVGVGLIPTVYALAFGPDGYLYAGGSFTSEQNGTPGDINRLARFNGVQWEEVGGGVDGDVETIHFDDRGNLYVGGDITFAGEGGGQTDSPFISIWNGSVWLPPDPKLNKIVYSMVVENDTIVLGTQLDGSVFIVGSHTYDIEYEGEASVYPIIEIAGSGQIYSLINRTTDAEIYFQDLSVNPPVSTGEVIYLDLTPGRVRMWSNYRKDLLGVIVSPVSNLSDWRLLPGTNSISIHADITIEVRFHYRKQYHSFDSSL